MTSESQIGIRSLMQRRWRAMGLTAAVVLVGGAAIMTSMSTRYETTAKLLVMRMDQRLGGVKAAQDALPELSGASRPLFTQAQILHSGPILDEVISRLDLRNPQGERLTADDLALRVAITPIKDTDVIQVTSAAPTAVESAHIVTTMFEAYERRIADFRRAGVREGLELIDEQLDAARLHLQNTENKLLAFKRHAGTVDLPEQVRRHVSQLADFDQDVQARQAEFERAQARAANLRQQIGMRAQDALAAISMDQNPRVQALREQIIAAETSPLRSQGLGPENPQLVALEAQTKALHAALKTETRASTGHGGPARPLDDIRRGLVASLMVAETDAQAALATLKVVEAGRSALRAKMAQYPDLEMQTIQLEREASVASEVYRDLLRKREEARVNLSIAPSIAQVIQPPAVPAKPVAPLRGQAAPVLLLTALAAAFGAGILREIFDRTMRPEDLSTHLPNLRVLATVPRLPRTEMRVGELVATRNTSPHFTEALRGLCLALEDELPPGHGKARVIALTSATPGEGKSVTAANLALCLAEAGHKVLLVDGDRHRPRVHSLFEIPEQRTGLTEVLQGQLAPDAGVHAAAGIHVVPAGGRRSGGRISRLRQRLGPAIDAWRDQYDFVLIDLPPMVMFAEVAHFARHADGILLLAAIERIAADTLSAAVKQLRSVRKPVLGLVALTKTGYASQRKYLASVSSHEAPKS